MRTFRKLGTGLNDRLVFSGSRRTHGASLIFDRDMCHPQGKREFLNGEEETEDSESMVLFVIWEDRYSDVKIADTLDELLGEKFKDVPVYLALSKGDRLIHAHKMFPWCYFPRNKSISIPYDVEELCTRCFFDCDNLCHVTFGAAMSLKRIGVEGFCYSTLEDIRVPDSVEEIL